MPEKRPPMTDLSNQRILIIGGTAGIGYETAGHMRDAGAAAVTIVGRSAARGKAAAKALGTDAQFVQGDAGRPEDAERIVNEAARSMGGIDVLFSCAGGDPMPRLLSDIPLDNLMPRINSSLAPVILPARAVYPIMANQKGGSIILLASDAGKLATPGEAAIGTAMAGIAMFARTMAIEAKRHGIRVNCLSPSIVRGTPLYEKAMADSFASKLFGKAEKMATLGVVEPRDLAEMAIYLASPSAAKITGQTISVTGGISAI